MKRREPWKRKVNKGVIPSFVGITRKDGESLFSIIEEEEASLSSEQVGTDWSWEVSSFSEPERVGGLFYRCCFLEAQGSGEVQHCQSPLLFKMNEYNLLLNISEMRKKTKNKPTKTQSLRNVLKILVCISANSFKRWCQRSVVLKS